jgi:hypothetical protein
MRTSVTHRAAAAVPSALVNLCRPIMLAAAECGPPATQALVFGQLRAASLAPQSLA